MSDPSAIGERAELRELIPLIRRAAGLDPAGLVRIRVTPTAISALIRLPFGVLVGRALAGEYGAVADGTYDVTELLAWLDGHEHPPTVRDEAWRGAAPPSTGWRRVETVPDDVVRDLVRTGALTLKQAAEREGLPNAQPRAEVADALLDSVVLTVTDAATQVEVSLRPLSALVRMGFLARDSHLAVDVAGRWTRLAASYGSAYTEAAGPGLGTLGVVASAAHPHRGVSGQQPVPDGS